MEVVQTIAPAVVSTGSQMIMQAAHSDERVGKIVGGLGLVWTACLLKNTAERSLEQKRSLTGWGICAGSFVVGCYGATQVISGLFELITPKNNFIPGLYVMATEPLSCDQHIQEIKGSFSLCPEATQAWMSTEAKGPFSIKCGAPQNVPTVTTTNHLNRTITIAPEIAGGKLPPMMLYEVKFLEHTDAILLLERIRCVFGSMEYARHEQMFHYQTAKETHAILESCCITRKVWPKEWHLFQEQFKSPSVWDTFETLFYTMEVSGLNADAYRRWRESCGEQQSQQSKDELAPFISQFVSLSLNNTSFG
jgi:hypothetical protein